MGGICAHLARVPHDSDSAHRWHVVGTCAVIDLRLLGVAREVPLTGFRRAPLLVWSGFGVNAITGAMLFLPAAEQKATQTISS